MADRLPSVSEVAFNDVSVSFARAHAGCTIVVLLGDARIRMIEQRAREVGSVAAVGCRSRSCGSTEQVGRDIDACGFQRNPGDQGTEVVLGEGPAGNRGNPEGIGWG